MDTRIGLLGPVEVRRDGVAVPALNGRLAVMLAAVAVVGGGLVGFAALEDYLWRDDPPERPRRALQNYATKLRQLLGDDVIQSSRDGFALGLERTTVDVFRFRSLATRPPDGTTPDAELRRLREALALWRGDPLSGLVPDALEGEYAPGLVDEFLSATERANELRLLMGDLGADLVTSLRQLVATHPWRERLWGQLMLALYRQGRQGEALTAFHDVVGVLREDLGIDPGTELVRLHERILAGDADLAEPEVTRVMTVPRPAQLPPALPDFVGRDDELPSLTALARSDGERVQIALVSGGAGAGKTSLAVQAAHAMRGSFPDGQLFANLRGASTPAAPADVLGTFLRALGVSDADVPAQPDERTALFRSLCAERKLLVVLDDAAGIEQVAPLLPGGPGCAVVVTSRPRLAMAADARIDLGMLSHDEARALMVTIIGRPRHEAEPDAADRVLRACGGSPLAVRIAASRLATRPAWPIEHMAGRLAGSHRLDELWLGDSSVQATFDTIFGSLEPVLAERLLLLGAVPANVIEVDFAAAAWNVDQSSARTSLEMLTDMRLLDFAGAADAFQWHDLVRFYATEHRDADRTAARQRVLHYVIRSLLNAKSQIRPGDRPEDPIITAIDDIEGHPFADRTDVHAWLHPRWAMLNDIAIRALGSGDSHTVAESAGMAVLLEVVSTDCCDLNDAEAVLRAVTQAPVPDYANRFTASAWHNLYTTLIQLSRHDEAREAGAIALERHRQRGDRYSEAILLHNMAFQSKVEEKYVEAREFANQANDLSDALPAPIRAWCLYSLADVEIELDDLDDARRHLDEADAIHRPDVRSMAAFRRATAWAEFEARQGSERSTVEIFGDVLAISEAISSMNLRAESYVRIARAQRRQGADSLDAAHEAVRLARDNHHVRVEAQALEELAAAYDLADDHEAAADARRRAQTLIASNTPTQQPTQH